MQNVLEMTLAWSQSWLQLAQIDITCELKAGGSLSRCVSVVRAEDVLCKLQRQRWHLPSDAVFLPGGGELPGTPGKQKET